jgi:cytochrome c peroxidase
MRASWLSATSIALAALAGCTNTSRGESNTATNIGADSSGGPMEDLPKLSADEMQLLRSLSASPLPAPPPDVSNSFADNAKAAELGRKLFSDSAFSGQLIDSDNDGGPNTLGAKGQAGRVSCAGCHAPQTAFGDSRSAFGEISLGAGWTRRRSPSLLDVGQAKIVMWGGRFSTLWSQPFGPLENPLEMNSSRLYTAQQIAQRYKADYESVFGQGALDPLADATRFPALTSAKTGCALTMAVQHPRAAPPDALYECHGTPGDKAEYDSMKPADQDLVTRVVINMGKAIAAFERTLSCGAGRFDAWIAGDSSALTASEQRGAQLFVGKAKCVGCHSGPYLSDQKFYNVGLKVITTREGILNANDHGAHDDLAAAKADPLGIAGSYSDGNDGRLIDNIGPEYDGAFRTPTLRCVRRRASYMHTGTTHTIEEAVAFFSRGGDPNGFMGTSVLTPLRLTSSEIADVSAFLRSLDGTTAATP